MRNLLLQKISQKKSIPFDSFMSLALLNDIFGYYKIQNPIGKYGDFITSPETSQIFGEIIGNYIAYVWQLIGSPSPFHLIELGSGKGTLLDDILRSTKHIPNFHKSINLYIVEVNSNLQKLQKQLLCKYTINITWLNNIENYHSCEPCFIFSNEFFDAIPVKQYKKINNKLSELYVDVDNKQQNLSYSYKELSIIPSYLKNKNITDIYEYSEITEKIFINLIDIIERSHGCILTIDYGYTSKNTKNTIRGFYQHNLINLDEILTYAPLCDITYNINYPCIQNLAKNRNTQRYKIMTQQDFLINCGIKERTKKLLTHAISNEDKLLISTSTNKLINQNDMGDKFKFMILSSKQINLPIFEKI